MKVHFCAGEIANEADRERSEPQLTELFFFDLLAWGFYFARRGMIVCSLVTGDAECDRLASAIGSFLEERARLLRSSD
jgi:glutamate-1-semialdehyde 2,1-aminomutase